MLPSIVLGLGAVACLMLALAIVLLAKSRRHAESDALSKHLQRTLERQAIGAAEAWNSGNNTVNTVLPLSAGAPTHTPPSWMQRGWRLIGYKSEPTRGA